MIAEIGGTQFKLSFSFVAAVTFMLYLCDEKIVLSSFASSLLHESGHIFMLKRFNVFPSYIELGIFGIRIESRNGRSLSYGKEALVALGGIIFNLSAALLTSICYLISGISIFAMLTAVNLLVAAVNSVPNEFLDLGRALHFLLLMRLSEESTTGITRTVSVAFTGAFALFCLIYNIFIGFNISLCAVTLYLVTITLKRKVDE